MKKLIALIISSVALISTTFLYTARAENMRKINVDIGKNIDVTAKGSGVLKWGTESHWGLKIYELVNLRPDVVAYFSRADFDITATPLFSLTMYADSDNKNNDAVTKIEFQYAYNATNHEEAKIFVENILKQFRKGKWKRHINDRCPAITGRSVFLDEEGKIAKAATLCPLDPAYTIFMEDWLILMRGGKSYEWIGDGVLAKLSVDFYQNTENPSYNIDIEFEDYAIKNRHDDAEQARVLAEGDQKGWTSTENFVNGIREQKEKVKILETNAIRRGDQLVARN